MEFYFTPAAIGYLTQLILSALISGYLLWRLYHSPRPRYTILIALFFLTLTGFLATLFFEASWLSIPRFYAVFLQIPLLCLAWFYLLDFAYHLTPLSSSMQNEVRVISAVAALYILWESGYAVYRFVRLRAGVVEYRIDWTDYLLLLYLLWPAFVFARQMLRHVPAKHRGWTRVWVALWHPVDYQARALRTFTLTIFFVIILSFFNLLRTFYLLPVSLANMGIAIGVLLALFIFVMAYLNYCSEATSFVVKLAGVTLIVMLAIMGIIGWVIAPVHIANYQPVLPVGRALRFTPNALGGYDIAEIPYIFEVALRENLYLDDGRERGCSPALTFNFRFYGQDYEHVYACNDGAIALGQPVRYREFQYRYGAGVPLLLPLLMDLDPTISPGGVFVRQESDRLIVTWERLRSFRQPETEFTFQAILYADGTFDFIYKTMSELLTFQPNDDPGATVWAIGALPEQLPDTLRYTDLQYMSWTELPVSGDPTGILYDYRLDFRRHVHQLLMPLTVLILVASLFIIGGFPLLFYVSLVNPLNVLLQGVQQMESGKYAPVPVQFPDEIGILTRAFNTLTARLGDLIHNLESRVMARTADLNVTNTQLRTEIVERERAQATVVEQQRALGAYEEREHLARDLHDGLGQVMGYINVQAQATQTFLEAGETDAVQSNLRELVQIAQQAHNDIRGRILGLRAAELPQRDFLAMIHYHIQQLREHCPIETSFDVPKDFPTVPFTPAGEEQVLHIIQEGLANIRKHACAHNVNIVFRLIGKYIQIVIEDDGCGFDVLGASQCLSKLACWQVSESTSNVQHSVVSVAASSIRFGLSIMHERAAKAGGQLEIHSRLDKGTRLVLTMPRFEAASVTDDLSAIKELRVLLADDHPLFLDGLRNLLMARGITVIGTARDGYEAQAKARALRPNVVVMDLNMPKCNGLEATRAIHTAFPDIKIVILTVAENETSLFDAIKSGASGYLLKNLEANTFCELLIGLLHGDVPLAPGMAAQIMGEFKRLAASQTSTVIATQDDDSLSTQQWEVLRMVAEGMIYKEIATELNLTEKTIKYHMRRILDLLHLDNRIQAIAYYQQRTQS